VAPVADGWHPVHDAVAKTYSYTIDNGAVADPFHRAFAWRPPFRLRLADLRRAAAAIPGQRDWQGFARRGDTRTDLVRRIDTVTWRADGDALVCTVTGASFTYRLVRSLVGAMVAVANGGCTKHDLTEALAGRRSPAGRQQAPAQGLCLERVRYDPELDWGG
jgi:tRNA pseudouridine38-40 synthase